jgi:hypothetical protein
MVAHKKWNQCPREWSRVAAKIAASVQRIFEGGIQKQGHCSREFYRLTANYWRSYASELLRVAAKEMRQCPWDVSKLAPKKLCQCPREISRVAAKKWRQCAGEVSSVAHKNCNSVLEKCPGWYPIMASVCRRSIERDTKNGVIFHEKYPGCQQKNCVSVQAKCRGCLQQMCVCVLEKYSGLKPKILISKQANCPVWHPKKATGSSRNIQGVILKWRQCAGEVASVEPKKANVSSRNVQGVRNKWRHCAGELLCVATKKGIHCPRDESRETIKIVVSVQANCAG